MVSEWTTLPIRKSVAEMFRNSAKAHGMTQDRFLRSIMEGNHNPNAKVYTYEPDEYRGLSDVADYLFATKNIERPEVGLATRFAIKNLMLGVAKAIKTVRDAGE